MREIALDTETTGFDPAQGDRIVEIGCVEMVNRVRTGKHFHCYLNPQRSMPESAFKVHGLSEAFLKDKPLFAEVVDGFLAFIGDAPLVIHNASFDMKFINAELYKAERAILPMERALDTVRMARQKFPGAPASLDALCKRFDIDLSKRTMHGALLDAELLAEVYLELMGGRQDSLLSTTTLSEGEDAGTMLLPQGNYEGLKEGRPDFGLSEVEQAAHRQFIKKIKEPIWARYLEEQES